jgi:hypothetical protein
VAERLVVGIFPQCDPQAIENALTAQKIDLSKLKVICRTPPDAEDTQLYFVDVIKELESEAYADEMTKGMGIIGDSGGTSVPGISGRLETLDELSAPASAAKRYLAAFAVPMDEVDNFDEAIADRRAVIIYPNSGDETDTVSNAFKAAGLKNVRAF